MPSVVDRLFAEYQRLIDILDERGEVSLRVATEATFQKVIVLSAASHFEMSITQAIREFVAAVSRGTGCVTALVVSQVLERRYHTLFDWNAQNANKFFSMFGADFKREMGELVREDQDLNEGIVAFLRIGRERNSMVHEDFGGYQLGETADEVMDLYRRACVFVERVPCFLENVCGAVAGVGE